MVNQKFNVHTLAADQMTNAQQLIRVSTDNAFRLALPMEARVENGLNVMESITMPFANVDLVSLAIQRLDAMLLVVQVTTNVQQTKLALTPDAKAHANRCRFVNEMRFAEFTIISHSAAAHREPFQNRTEHAEHMNHCVEMIANVHHSMLVSIANALTHAM